MTSYRLEAAADRAELFVYDYIGRDFMGNGIAADDLVRDLSKVKAKAIDVRINSNGGNVFDGLAIFNALARHSAYVTTHIDGVAASIASIIALAGREVRMAKNAYFMIHNAHAVAAGGADDMRTMANRLDQVKDTLVGHYRDKTGKSDAELAAWMDAETWFNATDAKAAGFVDSITDDMAVAASLDLSRFGNVPAELVARVSVPATSEPEPAGLTPEDERARARALYLRSKIGG